MKQGTIPVKVLLIEDNAYDARIVEDLLREMTDDGFTLRIAGSLQDAASADAQERADIALLDLNLPDSFGPETLLKAQKFMLDRPIIVLTGFYEEKLGPGLVQKGAQDFLVKGRLNGNWLGYSIKYSLERARIEQRMREREARFRELLEKIPEGFLVLSSGGRPVFANQSAERIFGKPHEALLAGPLPVDTSQEAPAETELRLNDGKRVPVEIHSEEILWEDESARLVMVQDLTKAKQLERARNEFISMASHELRSPLTIIRESIDLVCDGSTGDISEKQKEILRMGLENTGRLNSLIDALLDITKIEAGVMPLYLNEADLGGLLRGTADEYALLGKERGIAVTADAPEERMAAYCDEEKIREVLVNLASNALKFTPRGGKITFTLLPWEGQALFCVENTGPGIEPEDLPKLFNKFAKVGSSAEPGAKGTGLGLAISRGITEMHRGHIWAESEPGKNTKFFMLLPLPDFAEAARELARREISTTGGKRAFCSLTVLLPLEESIMAAEFIKGRFRSSNAMIRGMGGDITIFLPDSGMVEGAKAATLIQKGLRELNAGRETDARIIPLLYPEDFRNEEEYLTKMTEARGGQ